MRDWKLFSLHSQSFIVNQHYNVKYSSFHRAANDIFGKVGRLASEEVVVQLLFCTVL